ncbi:MAG: menaquinone biosynthesis protein [Planctomycetes bacterium]|nr:menaquinone biosynthesis protein [Planctomycetota bacterium]
MPIEQSRPLRIGAVGYLNSKPLLEGLPVLLPAAEIVLDYPSRLAEGLSSGELDVALIPSVECFQHPEYRVISDACVAAHGPVLSVKLYSRVPVGEIRRLALDEGSLTSAVLVRVILSERHGVEPEIETLPLGRDLGESDADAVLLIGDRAMHPPEESFVETWDLGEEWRQWTGLPFVFALWVSRGDSRTEGLDEAFSQARDRGVERLAEIAEREAKQLGIDAQTAYDYLRNNLHFQLGSAERSGLNLFRELAGKLDHADLGADRACHDISPA